MAKTEYIAFRATLTERLALEQLAERAQGNKSLVLRELVYKEALACGILLVDKKVAPDGRPAQGGEEHESPTR